MSSTLLSVEKIKKNFGPVQALGGVDFDIKRGEVHALIGENGAGKSTLMKILSGIYPAGSYEGQIRIVNDRNQLQSATFENTLESEKAGVAIIHQELSVFLDLSVAENFMVGHWSGHLGRFGFISQARMNEFARQWLQLVGAKFGPERAMNSLSIGEQQLVEIAKAVSRKSKVLIFDEPTSSLTQNEIDHLFALIAKLKIQGVGIVYISHRMEEVFTLADRVTVLRDGQSVFNANMKQTNADELIRHMVGRTLNQFYPPKVASESVSGAQSVTSDQLSTLVTNKSSEAILKLNNFSAKPKSEGSSSGSSSDSVEAQTTLKIGPLSLEIKPHEIVGIAGLLGAGRSELVQALCGDERFEISGEIYVRGKRVDNKNVGEAFRSGLGYVHEDRKNQSILPFRSLEENVNILCLNQKGLWRNFDPTQLQSTAQKELSVTKTRYSRIQQDIQDLSGGNQQKVVFGRVIQNNPDLLILDEPTRGVDVGAKFEIYQILREWAAKGKSVLMISSDLPELIGMCDRILVMSRGQLTGELQHSEFNQDVILKLALQER